MAVSKSGTTPSIVSKPIYNTPGVVPIKDPYRPLSALALSGMAPQQALDALASRARSPVAIAAAAGSTAEAMVEEKEDKARAAMPGSRRTRKRAQFGVGYNTGVSI